MPTKTESISLFLQALTHDDLANLYDAGMECQVNVAQDGGERIAGEYMGRRWQGYTDNLTVWKAFRIPYHANTEPEFNDSEIKFDLAMHAEAVGMTGWDWKNQCSKWVAFDFDAIIGHSDKNAGNLTNEELENVKNIATQIDWVTIRKSTSGHGLHIYVYVDNIPTKNHTEHSALARAILGKMSAETGFDFETKVDICGGNMWVWHRKMKGTDGLTLIKQGTVLSDVPINWRDHVKVVSGSSHRTIPIDIPEPERSKWEELCGQRYKVKLDDDHQALIKWLHESGAAAWWDQDHWMLVTHTAHLKDAYDDLNMRGHFDTQSTGKDHGDHNCFLFPMRDGAWAVRRYSHGVQEHISWDQDGAGWTRCFLNRKPDLATAAKTFGGLEDPKGGFIFQEAEVAAKAARLLGVDFKYNPSYAYRETTLKQHKDGRLIVEIENRDNDNSDKMGGWLRKGRKPWTQIFNIQASSPTEREVGNYDDLIRHTITETGEDYGWLIKSNNVWQEEPLVHIKLALASMYFKTAEITTILGSSVFKCWKLVNKPFKPEYPGDREWNRHAAQFRFKPSQNVEDLHYPSWMAILNHCGGGLDRIISDHPWCQANGILTGGDYFKVWIASLFQHPDEPLPYIFMYGPQNSGKSIFHEALSLLLTKGYRRADHALSNQSGFNGELEGAIICVVEETDLRRNKNAYNLIKDWVTAREISIRALYKNPFHVKNTTHWIQCANDHQACPIFTGDTRITMAYVEGLSLIDLIPKRRLIASLEEEASDFLAAVLHLEIPESDDRLNVPVIDSEEKVIAQELNQSDLEFFISEKCVPINGHMIKFSDFYTKFLEWVDPNSIHDWSKKRVGKELPPHFPKARLRTTNQVHIGNVAWAGTTEHIAGERYVIKGTWLIQEGEEK